MSFLPSVRTFASSGVQNRLKIQLEKEIAYERENYVIDESIPVFLEQRGFVLEDLPNSGLIKLRAVKGNYEVQV